MFEYGQIPQLDGSMASMPISEQPWAKEMVNECRENSERYGRVFCPYLFKRKATVLDRRMHRLIDDEDAQKTAFVGPRGLGKSTKLEVATAQRICARKCRFVLYVSQSFDMAAQKTEVIKQQLLTNLDIKDIYGDLKPKKYEGIPEEFSRKAWAVSDPVTGAPFCIVMPRGCEQAVRGVHVSLPVMEFQNGEWIQVGIEVVRPDWIVIDDLLDPDALDNEDTRKKARRWIAGDLLRTVEQFDSVPYRIFWAETYKHQDAPIEHFINTPGWSSERMAVCDENHKSLIPEIISDAQLTEERDQAKEEGTLGEFYRERMCISVPPEGATFQQKHFKYYDEGEEEFDESFVIVDPARTAEATSCFSAIVGVGVQYKTQKIFVRDLLQARLHTDEVRERAFGMADKLGTRVIGVEVQGADDLLKHPYENDMRRLGKTYEFVWLRPRRIAGDFGTGKEAPKRARVGALAIYYRQGLIYHNAACCDPLEEQLLSYPRPRWWDASDAFAYTPEMMEYGKRYFLAAQGPEFEEMANGKTRRRSREEREFGDLLKPDEALEALCGPMPKHGWSIC